MELDERKQKILEAVIQDYITSAEPVGSRTIARKYDLGVSAATIRNEMFDLETMGYLEQPHTSAGRTPSAKGYRFMLTVCCNRQRLQKMINGLYRHGSGIERIMRINSFAQRLRYWRR